MSEFQVPVMGQLNPKPIHLVVLKEKIGAAKSAHNRCFIALDKPATDGVGFIQAKGFFVEEAEEEIASRFKDLVSGVDKERIEEVLVPWVNIERIKNLVFKAK